MLVSWTKIIIIEMKWFCYRVDMENKRIGVKDEL